MLVSVVVLLAAPDMLIDELNRQNPELREDGMTSETLRRTVLYAGSLLVLWSVVASVVAVFAWRGRYWAWRTLLVSAGSATRTLPARRDRQPGDARPAGAVRGHHPAAAAARGAGVRARPTLTGL